MSGRWTPAEDAELRAAWWQRDDGPPAMFDQQYARDHHRVVRAVSARRSTLGIVVERYGWQVDRWSEKRNAVACDRLRDAVLGMAT